MTMIYSPNNAGTMTHEEALADGWRIVGRFNDKGEVDAVLITSGGWRHPAGHIQVPFKCCKGHEIGAPYLVTDKHAKDNGWWYASCKWCGVQYARPPK